MLSDPFSVKPARNSFAIPMLPVNARGMRQKRGRGPEEIAVFRLMR